MSNAENGDNDEDETPPVPGADDIESDAAAFGIGTTTDTDDGNTTEGASTASTTPSTTEEATEEPLETVETEESVETGETEETETASESVAAEAGSSTSEDKETATRTAQQESSVTPAGKSSGGSLHETREQAKMFIPPNLKEESDLLYQQMKLEIQREFGTELEKNRGFWTAVVELAVENEELLREKIKSNQRESRH